MRWGLAAAASLGWSWPDASAAPTLGSDTSFGNLQHAFPLSDTTPDLSSRNGTQHFVALVRFAALLGSPPPRSFFPDAVSAEFDDGDHPDWTSHLLFDVSVGPEGLALNQTTMPLLPPEDESAEKHPRSQPADAAFALSAVPMVRPPPHLVRRHAPATLLRTQEYSNLTLTEDRAEVDGVLLTVWQPDRCARSWNRKSQGDDVREAWRMVFILQVKSITFGSDNTSHNLPGFCFPLLHIHFDLNFGNNEPSSAVNIRVHDRSSLFHPHRLGRCHRAWLEGPRRWLRRASAQIFRLFSSMDSVDDATLQAQGHLPFPPRHGRPPFPPLHPQCRHPHSLPPSFGHIPGCHHGSWHRMPSSDREVFDWTILPLLFGLFAVAGIAILRLARKQRGGRIRLSDNDNDGMAPLPTKVDSPKA